MTVQSLVARHVKTPAEIERTAIGAALKAFRHRMIRARISPHWTDRMIFKAGWVAGKKWEQTR